MYLKLASGTQKEYEGKTDHRNHDEGKVDDRDIVDYLKLGSGTQKSHEGKLMMF